VYTIFQTCRDLLLSLEFGAMLLFLTGTTPENRDKPLRREKAGGVACSVDQARGDDGEHRGGITDL
jgi:hypothetical protein